MNAYREQARVILTPHPTAKHTWSQTQPEQGGYIDDSLYFDEMPMWADGDIYEPTEQPRHRSAS